MLYHLASKFAEKGAKTAIIRLTDHDRFMYSKSRDVAFRKSFSVSFKRKLAASRFTGPLISAYFRYLRRVDYDFSLLRHVEMIHADDPKKAPFSEKIIAGGWPAAYYVDEYVASHDHSEGFHFIQHAEDELYSWMSKYISASFDLPLRKIVTNSRSLERFKQDDPILFGVGVDTRFYHLKASITEKDPKTILIPLRAAESKGALYAIKALEILRKKNSGIDILAFGDMKADELPPYVKYVRYPSRRELLELYNTSSVFVLPSLLEGFSLPTIEAMSCGNAVVVTDNGGVNDYVRDGTNGLIVPTRDPESLAEAVRKLVSDIGLRTRMAEQALKTAQEYDIDTQCGRNVETFLERSPLHPSVAAGRAFGSPPSPAKS